MFDSGVSVRDEKWELTGGGLGGLRLGGLEVSDITRERYSNIVESGANYGNVLPTNDFRYDA